MPKDLRNTKREEFLTQAGICFQNITALKADASSRQYFRITLSDGKTYILADDAQKISKMKEFCLLSEFLNKHHIKAPKVYHTDFENGLFLIEDLGDNTFTRLLENNTPEEYLYHLGTQTLIDVANITQKPACCPALEPQKILHDICFFADWYLPLAKGTPLLPSEREEFSKIITALTPLAYKVPNRLVLWDYHVDNIMLTSPDTCALIDFQDALWGPLSYDLMSLLEDARRSVSPQVVQKMKQKFLSAFEQITPSDFEDSYAFLSMFRHMRVLGRFTILAYVNGKTQYLQFIPHIWDMLTSTLERPALKPVKTFLDKVLPEAYRIIPQKEPFKEALVLAAGRGTRMRHLSQNCPKPLIKVNGKALIDYNFERLKNFGIKNVVVNTCYLSEQIKAHLKQTEPEFSITFSEEPEALETGGGIKNALPLFKGESILVCNSDVFFQEESTKPALWRMFDAYDPSKQDVLLLLQDINNVRGDKSIGDYKIVDNMPVRNVQKETEGYNYMFAGIYIVHKRVFEDIEEKRFSSLVLFDKAQKTGRLGYVINQSTFYHIGTPEALEMAEKIK